MDQPAMESTQELSVEERMMANLDDVEVDLEEVAEEATEGEPEEAIEEGEAEAEIEAESNEVINIDGEEYEVPVPLKDAFMRQQDYTRKTQELSAQRKALDEQIQLTQQQAQFQQQFQEQIGQLSAIDAQLKQYESINWQSLQNDDPVQFVALRDQYRDLKDARNYYSNDLNQKQQQQAILSQQHYAKLKEQGVAELRNSIKGWSDETARNVKSFGMETYGFADNELASIIDPRMVKVLHDAYLYRKGASVSTKKVIGKPQLGKPKAQQAQATQNTQKLRQALKKTGDKQYAARAIEALL
jgi:hypothetical protein